MQCCRLLHEEPLCVFPGPRSEPVMCPELCGDSRGAAPPGSHTLLLQTFQGRGLIAQGSQHRLWLQSESSCLSAGTADSRSLFTHCSATLGFKTQPEHLFSGNHWSRSLYCVCGHEVSSPWQVFIHWFTLIKPCECNLWLVFKIPTQELLICIHKHQYSYWIT